MSTLIYLTGPARAGKSTVAEMIRDYRGKKTTSIAPLGELVKLELAGATGVPMATQEAHRDRWRRVWQFWGTEVRRELFGENYWLEKWAKNVHHTACIIVPDARFVNEGNFLRRWGRENAYTTFGVRVWGRRDGLSLFNPRRWHRSEREWRRVQVDYELPNRADREELWERCEILVEDLGVL